jgi:hypothetical protein
MMPINLYDIYRKVYFRCHKAAKKSVYTQIFANSMHDAAKAILEKPTIKSVKDFEKIESIYLICPGVRSGSTPIAFEFYAALRSKNYYVVGPHLNTHRNGKIVTNGWIYFLKSADKPGQVKIGFTTQDVYLRMAQIRNREQLSDLVMHFYVSTNKTSELEDAIHSALKTAQVSGRVEKNKSKEWFYIKGDPLVNALFSMAQQCDATVKVEWASPHYKKLLATKFICS